MAHIRKYDFDYARRHFMEKTARGFGSAGVLGALWPIISQGGDVVKAYPEELTNIETSFLLINNDQFLLFRNYASIAFDPPGAGDRSRLWVEWKSEGPAVSSMVVVEPQA